MKNVIIVNDFDYVQGGASKVALDTAEILKDSYNVTFFSAVSDNKTKNSKINFVSTNQQEALKDKNKIRGFINGLYNFTAAKELKKLLKEYNPNDTTIHIHGWTKALSSSIFRVAFKKNYKVVLTLHDYFTACPNGGYFNYKENRICKLNPLSIKCNVCNCDSRNYFFKLYRIIRQFIQNKIVKLNTRLEYAIGISDLNMKVLKDNLPNATTRKILNPIDLDLDYSFNIKNDYYLYLGRVSKEKGVEIFASTMQKYNKKAIVVGDGSELERLKIKYPNVSFVGWKDKNEIQKYLKNAKALVLPSLWYEGAPLTPLEAMSFGIPCIISNLCAGREYITNNGYVFDPYVENDLIEKIDMLESNIEKCSLNSFEYVKKYDKDNYLKEISKFYNYILKKK